MGTGLGSKVVGRVMTDPVRRAGRCARLGRVPINAAYAKLEARLYRVFERVLRVTCNTLEGL